MPKITAEVIKVHGSPMTHVDVDIYRNGVKVDSSVRLSIEQMRRTYRENRVMVVEMAVLDALKGSRTKNELNTRLRGMET